MFKWDQLIINANLATLGEDCEGYGMQANSAVGILNGKVEWIGKTTSIQQDISTLANEVIDAKNNLLTPGLIDCHTHLVFAGNRSQEFEQRLNGVSYEDIAKAGGGILSTVHATRQASFDELYEQSLPRFLSLIAEGVTTVEIKSGYGLTFEDEIKMLKVAKKLGEDHNIRVKTTFLAAHAVPPEYKGEADKYVDLICQKWIPKVAELGWIDAVDAFCEGIGFSHEQTKKVFDAAARWGLTVKLHADQLSDLRGAALVAEYSGLSADHVEYTNLQSVKAMAKAGTVAVLLPYAFYMLKETQLPPIEHFKKHHVPIAISTDCNPGTAPSSSLLTSMNKACVLFSLTPEDVLRGVTVNAATALGIEDQVGSIEVGKQAEMVLWNCKQAADLCYWQGLNPVQRIIK